MRPIIKAAQLGKHYRIGEAQGSYETVREAVVNTFRAPLERLKRKREASGNNLLWALDDVSFTVAPGEVLGVIGRNGAGKSTLLKVLTRITEPTRGRVELYGRVGSLLEVGTGFHPELTGRENIYLNGAILGMARTEITRRFDEIVAFAETEKFLDTPVKRYSSGMYMRLAFAVAAHMESEILLVDEVLAVGDQEFQKKCLGKMKDVSEGGRTVLFVSHNLSAISTLCSRVLWLEKGCVASSGSAGEVVASYISSGSSARGEIVWPDANDAPSDGQVRLEAIRVVTARGITSDVFIDEPITIEIEYFNNVEDNLIIWGIEVKDKLNAYVFATNNRPLANAAEDVWYGRPQPAGRYKTRCVVPANLLNSDFYSADLRLVNHRNELKFCVENVVSFIVHESDDLPVEYSGVWPGVVRPRLAWTTEYVGRQ